MSGEDINSGPYNFSLNNLSGVNYLSAVAWDEEPVLTRLPAFAAFISACAISSGLPLILIYTVRQTKRAIQTEIP